MDDIRRMLDRLPELSDQELTDLETEIVKQFGSVESQEISRESVEAMTFLADSVESVRAEMAAREAELSELAAQASEASARISEASDSSGEEEDAPVEGESAPAGEAGIALPEDFAAEGVTAAAVDEEEYVDEVPEEGYAEEAPVEDAAGEAAPEGEGPAEAIIDEVIDAAVDDAIGQALDEVVAEEFPEGVPDEVVEAIESERAEAVAGEEEENPEKQEAAVEEFAAGSEEVPADTSAATELAAAVTEEVAAEEAVSTPDAVVEPVFAAREDGVVTTESVEAPMGETTAGPDTFSAPADRLPAARAAVNTVPVSLVAGGDIPGITAGSTLSGSKGLADAMALRLHTLRRAAGGHGDQVVVASLMAQFPDDRTLRGNEVDSNNEKIKAVTASNAIVASGGWCAPLPTNYDIFDIGGSTDTPVKDALPVFNADRGGVRFIKPPTVADYVGAVGIWTGAGAGGDPKLGDDYLAGQTGATNKKPCLTVTCAAETEVYLDAVTTCLCFGNLQSRAFPELIDRHNQLALVEAARVAENYILGQIKAGSTAVTVPAVLGTARDVLISVERAATHYRYIHRLDPELPLRFVAPQWVRAMIRSDLTAQLPGDGLETTFNLADSMVNSFFEQRNIRPVWSLEGVLGTTEPTALDYPNTVEWGLFAEGAYTLLDGGTLDIGLVRDMNLVSTNDYCMFTEQFLAVARTGPEGLWATQTLKVNGGSAGTLDVAAVDY